MYPNILMQLKMPIIMWLTSYLRNQMFRFWCFSLIPPIHNNNSSKNVYWNTYNYLNILIDIKIHQFYHSKFEVILHSIRFNILNRQQTNITHLDAQLNEICLGVDVGVDVHAKFFLFSCLSMNNRTPSRFCPGQFNNSHLAKNKEFALTESKNGSIRMTKSGEKNMKWTLISDFSLSLSPVLSFFIIFYIFE